jgi:hypothetical protein
LGRRLPGGAVALRTGVAGRGQPLRKRGRWEFEKTPERVAHAGRRGSHLVQASTIARRSDQRVAQELNLNGRRPEIGLDDDPALIAERVRETLAE